MQTYLMHQGRYLNIIENFNDMLSGCLHEFNHEKRSLQFIKVLHLDEYNEMGEKNKLKRLSSHFIDHPVELINNIITTNEAERKNKDYENEYIITRLFLHNTLPIGLTDCKECIDACQQLSSVYETIHRVMLHACDLMDSNHVLKNALKATHQITKSRGGSSMGVTSSKSGTSGTSGNKVPGLLNVQKLKKVKKSKKNRGGVIGGVIDNVEDITNTNIDDLAVHSGSMMESSLKILYEHEVETNSIIRKFAYHDGISKSFSRIANETIDNVNQLEKYQNEVVTEHDRLLHACKKEFGPREKASIIWWNTIGEKMMQKHRNDDDENEEIKEEAYKKEAVEDQTKATEVEINSIIGIDDRRINTIVNSINGDSTSNTTAAVAEETKTNTSLPSMDDTIVVCVVSGLKKSNSSVKNRLLNNSSSWVKRDVCVDTKYIGWYHPNPSLAPTGGVQIRWIDTIQLFDMNDIKSKFLKNLIPVFR